MAAAGREGGPVGPGELCSLGNLLEVALERAHQKLAGFITSAGEKSEECRRVATQSAHPGGDMYALISW